MIRQRLRTPQARYYENMTVRDTQGVVVSHLPRSDPSLILKQIDEDFVKAHPIVRDEVIIRKQRSSEKRSKDSNKCSERLPKERRRIRITKDAFLNPNVPLEFEESEYPKESVQLKRDSELRNEQQSPISDSESSYATEEQMKCLPQMINVYTMFYINS